MDRGAFEVQAGNFIKNDPTIFDRANQTAQAFNEDRLNFINTLADTATPEHFWNIAMVAVDKRNINLATALALAAQVSMNYLADIMHRSSDAAVINEAKEQLENFGHVIDLIETVISPNDDENEIGSLALAAADDRLGEVGQKWINAAARGETYN